MVGLKFTERSKGTGAAETTGTQTPFRGGWINKRWDNTQQLGKKCVTREG